MDVGVLLLVDSHAILIYNSLSHVIRETTKVPTMLFKKKKKKSCPLVLVGLKLD